MYGNRELTYAGGMPKVASNGVELEYADRGNGDPLLLVMGLGGQLTSWPEGFVDELIAQGFRVIAFDNRDSGLSTEMTGPGLKRRDILKVLLRRPVTSPYKLNDMAGDAIGLLDALDISQAHIVGASMGGMISQEIAIGWPGRVQSLTSIMSNTGDRKSGMIDPKLALKLRRQGDPNPNDREAMIEQSVELWKWISGPTFDEAEAREFTAAGIDRALRVEGIERQTAAIFASRDRTAALRLVRTPTLVVHGLVDPLVRSSGGEATARAIPDARLLMFPEMGHDLPECRWKEIAGAIRQNADRAPLPV